MARHSSHRCLGAWDGGSEWHGGADLGTVDAPRHRLLRNQKERSCLFHHVCFDRRRRGWAYFARPAEFSSARSFPTGVDIWARGDFARAAALSVDHSFAVHRGGVPSRGAYFSAPLLIKVAALAPANFGHFLGNAMFPAFEAAWRFFGAASLEMRYQLLLAGANQSEGSRRAQQCAGRGAEEARRGAGRGGGAARQRCASHARLVGKFAAELLPGLSDFPLLWEGALADGSEERWVCARSFIVGTGDFGFSTVHRLLNGTRRRPPKLLWGDFIGRIIRRLDPSRPSDARVQWGARRSERRCALLVVKHGRRAVLSSAYDPLRTHLEATLGIPTHAFEPAALPVAEQVRIVGRGAVAFTPDGGVSFICAFLPQGAALVVLGWLERWAWANDPRVRAYYCTPRQSKLVPCGAAHLGSDCFNLSAVQPCLDDMIARALKHVQLTWPSLGHA
ncbi:hypothetical protein AB1Y20_011196 [Prymnesium parvum]|uniref:Uncharacterized protein n=1 Tax=Prymnesium parvum TaxID=97485 RepID=A0AB34IMN8_PRYPA